MRTPLVLGDTYTIETWLWNGLAPNARAVTVTSIHEERMGRAKRGANIWVSGEPPFLNWLGGCSSITEIIMRTSWVAIPP